MCPTHLREAGGWVTWAGFHLVLALFTARHDLVRERRLQPFRSRPTVNPRSVTTCQSCGSVFGNGLTAAAAVFAISASISLLKPATPTAPTTLPPTRTGMPPRNAVIPAVTN